MSGFIGSIVRGAGFTIGRNIVGDFGKRKGSSSNGRFYERAENGVEKALNFPIQGRSDTILGKCFNLYQEFENETKISFMKKNVLFSSSRIRYYKEIIEKLEDSIEYMELKNPKDENIEKIDTVMSKVTDVFKDYINTVVPTLLLEKDIEYVKESWVKLKPIYLQTNTDSEMIDQIDEYCKSYVQKVREGSESIWPGLIGALIGISFVVYCVLWIQGKL
jgi:hypothetical protein